MCEHSRKLVLWMDGELGDREAAEVETHVRECAECGERFAAYKDASGAFEAYCDAVVEVAQVAEEVARPMLAETSPRAEGAARQNLLSELKLRPPKIRPAQNEERETAGQESSGERVDDSSRGEVPASFAGAEGRREIPPLLRTDRVRDDNVKQKRARVVMGIGAMAAAAAIAMVLMIPRHRVGQIPASINGNGSLHAVQRPAEGKEGVQRKTAETMERGRATDKNLAMATQGARATWDAAPQNAEPRDATRQPIVAKRTAPRAVDAGEARRRAAERPARVEEAKGAAPKAKNQIPKLGERDDASAAAAETPIEIAVPTENMFPPGAVPPGIGFTAVVTISADDAAQLGAMRSYQGLSASPQQGLTPSPRLTRFSNGGNQP